MKSKNPFFENLKLSIDSYSFKIILVILMIMNIIYTLNILYNNMANDYIRSIYYIFSNVFYITILFSVLVINTINIIIIFERNLFYIIRFNNKKEYYKILIKNIFYSNLLLYILNLFLLFMMSNFVFGTTFSITIWKNYEVSNIIYIVYYFARCLIILEIVMILLFLIKKYVGKIGTLIFSLVSLLPLLYNDGKSVNSLLNIPLFPISYIKGFECKNFNFEFFSSTIYILILISITIIIFNIIINRKKGTIEE